MKVKKLDEIKGLGLKKKKGRKGKNCKSNIAKEASEIKIGETHPYFLMLFFPELTFENSGLHLPP